MDNMPNYQPNTANEVAINQQNNALLHENYNHSQNEQALYNELQKATAEKQQLSDTIANMQQLIKQLEDKIKAIEATGNAKPNSDSDQGTSKDEYWTDEEELAKETEWIRVKYNKNNKKRKLNTSLTPPQQQEDVSKTKPNAAQQKTKKAPAPPPIIVDGIKAYDQFYDEISKSVTTDKFNVKILNGENMKINVVDDEAYRTLTRIFTDNKLIWHTYESKQYRPIRVMAKNLHHSCKPDRIIRDLRDKGFKAIDAVNKLKWRSKVPLDMFMLTFEANESINKIHEIANILGCKVEIQPLRKSKLLPQCKSCQAFGHTQKYCNKEPRCVKCAGKHHTKNCKKTDEAKPKCVHCGEAHPASYRGCSVAKELQKIKNKNMNMKKPSLSQRHAAKEPKNTKGAENPQKKNVEQTFAKVASSNNQKKEQQNDDINQTLRLILAKLNRQENLINALDERLEKIEHSAKETKPPLPPKKNKNGQHT